MSETLYKVLDEKRMPCHGGSGRWPHRRWTYPVKPVPCVSGYHVCRADQLLGWLGPRIWEVEVRGAVVDHGDKLVAESARLVRLTKWNDRSARLFAADCAERVLPIFEKHRPDDHRPREVIEVVRRFAAGDATDAERAAAWDAAGDAAGDAAWDAARAAAWAAARDAAWAAASDAAWTTESDAARDTERQWQTGRLLEYLEGTR